MAEGQLPQGIGLYSMQWAMEEANLGEGISRPKEGAATKLFRLRVKAPQARVMVMSKRAESAKKAIEYARNCWPNAEIELLADAS